MGKLVKVKIEQTEIWMETEDVTAEKRPERVSREEMAEATLNAVENIHGTICAYCSSLLKAFDALEGENKPTRLKAAFGLGLSGDCKAYIVNAGANASLMITAEWDMS